MLKQLLLRQMRRRALQPLWERLGHLSLIGRNHWATHLALSGEMQALDVLGRLLPASPVVLDVGANDGAYSVEAARRLRPRVIFAFEPSSAAFAQLVATVEEAGLADVVQPQRSALGRTPGQATLHSSRPGASIASLLPLRDSFEAFDSTLDEAVPVTTIDGFWAERGIAAIDLLKIDVEGFELEVLEGAGQMLSQGAIGSIQFEFGVGNIEARTFFRDFYDRLSRDYQLFRIVSDGLWPVRAYSSELEQCSPVNYLAIARRLGPSG